MRLVNKLFSVLAVFIYWTAIALADSNGTIFNWQPFVVKDYLELNKPLKNIMPENLFAMDEKWGQFADVEEFLHSDLMMINNSPKAATKKSALSKIKISVSQVHTFMMPSDDNYSKGKDQNLSQAARILPSLLRSPSQEATLETLKVIEPRLNLGIEF
jgi:hypothetical protein